MQIANDDVIAWPEDIPHFHLHMQKHDSAFKTHKEYELRRYEIEIEIEMKPSSQIGRKLELQLWFGLDSHEKQKETAIIAWVRF